jgi:hypothetical protein
MRRRAVLVGLLTAACGKSRKAPPPVHWFDDLELASAEATRTNRPLLLAFFASWDCVTKEFEHHTFPDPDIASLLYDFVCVNVDCSDDEDETTIRLTKRFSIVGIATLVITHSARQVELARVTEYMPPEKLAVVLRATRARHAAMHDIDESLRLGAAWRRPVVFGFLPAYDASSLQIRNAMTAYPVATMLRDSFLFVDVWCDDGSNDEWGRFKVLGSPALVVMDGARRVEITRLEHGVDSPALTTFLDGALARYHA